MYLHLGNSVVKAYSDIICVFDLDNASQSSITREFLRKAEQSGRIVDIGGDLPKSFVVTDEGCGQKIYLSQLASSTLRGRAENFSV